jgi:hypothetical protein
VALIVHDQIVMLIFAQEENWRREKNPQNKAQENQQQLNSHN